LGRRTDKKVILNAAIEKQQLLIADFNRRIKDAMMTDGNVNEDQYDNHSQTFTAAVMAEVNELSRELDFARNELQELMRIDTQAVCKVVTFGAVVRTDQMTFFVSSSLEEFRANGQNFFGISTHAPLYKAMRGKKVGESFQYRRRRSRIKDIY
jgi:hypothetical protein